MLTRDIDIGILFVRPSVRPSVRPAVSPSVILWHWVMRGNCCTHHHTFYRATLCVNAVFTVARCPSVGRSRWCIVSRWLKISSNFFLSPVSGIPIILVFWHRAPVPNSKENPSTWAQNTWGWGNFANFDWNRRLSRKRYEIGTDPVNIKHCVARGCQHQLSFLYIYAA